jgi:hypothetical protein
VVIGLASLPARPSRNKFQFDANDGVPDATSRVVPLGSPGWGAREAAPRDIVLTVGDLVALQTTFTGTLVYWRGPSPFRFIPVPPPQATEIGFLAPAVTYGWGVIPVRVRVGRTDFTTSLFPTEGGYLVPVKDAVRRAEGLSVGDVVSVQLAIGR